MNLHLDELTHEQLIAVGIALQNPGAIIGLLQYSANANPSASAKPEDIPGELPPEPSVSTSPEQTQTADPNSLFSQPPAQTESIAPTTVGGQTETPPEFDIRGVPWDARIHAATRTKVSAGTWKYKRGIDKTMIATVEAELSGAQVSTGHTTTENSQPPAPAVDLAAVMAQISKMLTGGHTPQRLTEILFGFGISSTAELGQHPDKFDALIAALQGEEG